MSSRRSLSAPTSSRVTGVRFRGATLNSLVRAFARNSGRVWSSCRSKCGREPRRCNSGIHGSIAAVPSSTRSAEGGKKCWQVSGLE